MGISLTVFSNSRITIPEDLPVSKCSNLEKELQSFADDLTRILNERRESTQETQEGFNWILMDIRMALDESPSNCEYAIQLTKRKHREFLSEVESESEF